MIKNIPSYLLGALSLGNWPLIFPDFRQSSQFLSETTVQWLEDARGRYDAPGFAIGIIASPARTGEDWKTEILTFGHKDHKGGLYEAEVCPVALTDIVNLNFLDGVPYRGQRAPLCCSFDLSTCQQ